ncbi:hypothetical protein [Leucobacter ruminantium]|uniref:Uncharacterized protein n=1 Tax=Leucobacter ruminantium TaxID=1289170 RepID=A0A939LYA0_9MICO|nr:hypothetical protein [Leucobacter ruminantium]MBO1805168.1 hypothetical protein [Leucobacter ruminantium]
MSEHDEQRPMTRRERRMREMAETGALDLSEALQEQQTAEAATPEAATTQSEGAEPTPAEAPEVGEIEISPFNEDGTPRSRREMRQLREAALAEREAAQAAVPADAEAAPEASAEAPEAPAEAQASKTEAPVEAVIAESVPEQDSAETEAADAPSDADAAADAEHREQGAGLFDDGETAVPAPPVSAVRSSAQPEAPVDVPDFDTLMAPPTEPFSVEELREAEQTGSGEDTGLTEDGEGSAAAAEPVPAEKPKRRFWQRNKSEAASEPADAEPEGSDAPVATEQSAQPEPAQPEPASASAEPAPERPEPHAEIAPETAAIPAEVPEAVQPDPSPQSQDSAQPKYSFPDIQPPEEWRSVFDDPSARSVPEQGAEAGGDFDDLISRAVAQEGATGSSTSALILPSMPEDTGGLTGPLGATGELYVTGSIELSRSISETGGHSALHDSLKFEPVTMPVADEPAPPAAEEGGPTPVAAKHAVSARMPSGVPVVAKPTKEKSKLPLILTLSGGGLLAAIIGLGVWGAMNGMFSG